jgi:5-methylcytosine-specific restriction endonuclease McrA
VPLAEGGPDAPTNVQALCQDCSDAKTEIESRRGRGGAAKC